VKNIIRIPHIAIMSFETTATIANFGGKLLKLAHQVNTHMERAARNDMY